MPCDREPDGEGRATPITSTAELSTGRPEIAWHALPPQLVLAELGSTPEGLSSHEARSRIARFGPNRVERTRRVGPLTILLRQLASPVIYILIVAAVATMLLGKVADTIVILTVVLVNTLVCSCSLVYPRAFD